jgi:serine/threonine protein kinase/tetratricopeptide (TPR) repeat protein
VTPERWQKVKEVLGIVLEAAPEDRASCLAQCCAGDESLGREVEKLLEHEPQVGASFLEETSLAEVTTALLSSEDKAWFGRRVGAYKIISQLGIGGMGEVYRAIRADGQYTKEVAIKLVRSGLDTGSVIERFRNERQILASLDHPNIARLVDGGTSEEGVPFLVMELIDGEPIDAYCNRRKLTVTERLKLFQQACSAVQYAHQRLVIHRDIKPGNILVTNEGTLKLLDFGIAKILAPIEDAQVTMTLTQAMTPEYASPEQIRGETITTATDVYSLGVVLYRLMTGHSPYSADTRSPHKLALAVCETEPDRPSASVLPQAAQSSSDAERSSRLDFVKRAGESTPAGLQRRLVGDLDNIVLMALRKEPERRYASAERLADDLRRHMDGLPVSATKGSWSYRSGKFVRRHKAAMAASLAVVLALGIGIVLTVREAKIARQQAAIADTQRQRAEKRFEDVRKLSDSFIVEMHDAIQNLPGSTPARKLVLDRALEYLDSASKDASGNPDLERELAKGYQRLAVVQGNAAESNLGEADAGLASDQKALVLFEDVARTNPNNLQDQLNVAMMYRIRSFSALNDASGQKDLEHAIAITDHVLQIDPTHPVALSESAVQQQNVAFMLDAAGERARAIEAYRKNYEVRQGLWKAKPGMRSNRQGMGMSQVLLGEALAHMDSREEGLKFIDQGIGYYESLVKDVPGINERRELTISRQKRGDVLFLNGDAAGALAIYRDAQDALQAMAKTDPKNTMLQIDLANMNYYQGRTLAVLGRDGEATNFLQRSLAMFEKVRDAAINSEEYPRGPAGINIWLGDVSARKSNLPRALQSFKSAIAVLETKKDPLDDDDRCEMATALVRVGQTYMRMSNPREASAAFQKALDIANPAVALQHKDVPALYPIEEAQVGKAEAASALSRLAQSAEDRSRLAEEARAAGQASVETWSHVPDPSRFSPGLFSSNGPSSVKAGNN